MSGPDSGVTLLDDDDDEDFQDDADAGEFLGLGFGEGGVGYDGLAVADVSQAEPPGEALVGGSVSSRAVGARVAVEGTPREEAETVTTGVDADVDVDLAGLPAAIGVLEVSP